MRHPIAELAALARDHRHLREDRHREGPDGRWRRVQGHHLEGLVARFEALLERWVPEEATREAWREHLHGRAPLPERPPFDEPPLFVGRSEDGGRLEVVPDGRRLVQIRVDGQLSARMPRWTPTEEITLGQITYREVTEVPEEGLEALRVLVAEGQAPGAWARALHEDGLLDRELGLTDRGRRALGALGGPTRRPTPRFERWHAPAR